ncbi:MAG: ABC transporter ATP-binding protein [Candidatus Marinimicrobia bacterium]|nr:ABC transporter ATP-binding protein [Candidatus Neomarinimicrobiota bacterium]|tara:strand:- start:17007 stop:17180 length:174 start_codon:yes stop_codon:yes gene_type:complete
MIRHRSLDYIFGMVTGASLIFALWACTGNNLNADTVDVQEVIIINKSWDPVNVKLID